MKALDGLCVLNICGNEWLPEFRLLNGEFVRTSMGDIDKDEAYKQRPDK